MIEIVKKHRQKKAKAQPKPAPGALRVRNSYEAASTGRRLVAWRPFRVGPNNAILQNLDTLRARSRDSVRNNAWISKGVSSWVSNEIGTGIIPRAISPDGEFNKACDTLWERWTRFADADGLLDYYGLTSMASRARVEGGEVFLRYRVRSPRDGLPVPLQLQLIEPELCPHTENQFFTAGRRIRAGIEFDGIGRRVAYWMYKTHPGDSFFSEDDQALVRVPADLVRHHFAPLRPGQIRGVPWTVQALIKAKVFDEYDDAELVRKRDKAAYTGAITHPDYDLEKDAQFDPITGESITKDADGVPTINVQAGSFFSLLPGEEVKLFEGDSTGQGYADFIRQALLGLFAGMNVPYEFGSGDMKNVNDRVMRVIRQEYHRVLEQSQWHLSVPQVCQPTREMFVRMAIASGALTAPGFEADPEAYYATAWGPQRWEYLHPVQDVQADMMEIKGGLSSRKRKVAERGDAVELIDQENAEDRAREDELGLTYDSRGKAESGNMENEEDVEGVKGEDVRREG